MEIFWSDIAKSNLTEIFEYYNEAAGGKVAQTINKKDNFEAQDPDLSS